MRALPATVALVLLSGLAWAPGAAIAQEDGGAAPGQAGGASAPGGGAAPAQEGAVAPCPEPVDGDPATLEARADEHFLRGNQLYNEGQYELAIAEFTAVYCLVPVPEAAYNIASSYMGLVDYERALEWLELYVRLLPPNKAADRTLAANRIDRIRKLPARVRVTTQPPGARVRLVSDQGEIVGQGDADELRAPAGSYTIRVEKPGYVAVEQEVTLRIGQPYTYSFRLDALQGQVRVVTVPENARIFIDDRLLGVGAFIGPLTVGEHTITAEADGHTPRTERFTVVADAQTTLRVNLDAQPKTGRWELVPAMTAYGTFGGLILGGDVLDGGSRSTALIALGGASVGFAASYFGARRDVPLGHTSYVIGGTLWGVIEGFGVTSLFTDGDRALGIGTLSGLTVGALFTTFTAKRFDPSAGDAALVNSGGLWGTTTGLMLWGLFDGDPELFGPFVLVGVNAGLLGGSALSFRYDYSRGHVALIDAAGVGGMLVGLSLATAFLEGTEESSSADDTRLHFSFGGMLVGLLAGALLTRNMDVPELPAAITTTAGLGVAHDHAGAQVPTLTLSGTF